MFCVPALKYQNSTISDCRIFRANIFLFLFFNSWVNTKIITMIPMCVCVCFQSFGFPGSFFLNLWHALAVADTQAVLWIGVLMLQCDGWITRRSINEILKKKKNFNIYSCNERKQEGGKVIKMFTLHPEHPIHQLFPFQNSWAQTAKRLLDN